MAASSLMARLETFCDGVIAIAITLLILEIKVPPLQTIGSGEALRKELAHHWTSWFAFLLSFISLFIAWINHNRTMHLLHPKKISAAFIYAHGLLILTICVYPFATALLAEYLNSDMLAFPAFIYCLVNMVHAACWVLIYHCALKPVFIGKNENARQVLFTTRRTIFYTVIFNAVMCIIVFWVPLVAMALTALAWFLYLIMGIILSPLEPEES